MDMIPGLYGSTIGKKILMAVTGIVLFLFVFVHMIGNLQIFLGAEHINRYAHFLHEGGLEIVLITRAVLAACIIVHIIAAFQVWLRNRGARPVKYRVKVDAGVTYAAKTMVWSGPVILAFIVYHLMHLTAGTVLQQHFVEGDVYHNVIASFQLWPVAAGYIVANMLLAFHLYHGLWSLFQTLGLSHPRFNLGRRLFAVVISLVIAVGNISIPVSVLAGWIR